MTAEAVTSFVPSRKHPKTMLKVTWSGYSVRPLQGQRHAGVRLSEVTERTFSGISDPANAHLFSVESALKAFAHIKV